jgi:hypothetical protein
MIKYSTAFLLLLLILSCGTQQKQSKSNTDGYSDFLFSLKTSSCMGECPVYSFSIKTDSTFLFDGKEHTMIKGIVTRKLSMKEYAELISIIDEVTWGSLKSNYTSDMSDLPTKTFYYNFNKEDIKVTQYGNEPKDLSAMYKKLYEHVNDAIIVK